ncbi:hypothetical protein PC119_g23504 [Phytophthora cactorum]|nr:hypothetical protein PC119_g23504 [Phytophthora cactorum]KAG4041993.1 hypothetical protein PC123_g22507 [Phytophthora cactorum]
MHRTETLAPTCSQAEEGEQRSTLQSDMTVKNTPLNDLGRRECSRFGHTQFDQSYWYSTYMLPKSLA